MLLKIMKLYTIFVPSVKSIQTKKIAIGFFCPMGFLKADMSLKSSHGVLKFGYFDFLLGGIERWVFKYRDRSVKVRQCHVRQFACNWRFCQLQTALFFMIAVSV